MFVLGVVNFDMRPNIVSYTKSLNKTRPQRRTFRNPWFAEFGDSLLCLDNGSVLLIKAKYQIGWKPNVAGIQYDQVRIENGSEFYGIIDS